MFFSVQAFFITLIISLLLVYYSIPTVIEHKNSEPFITKKVQFAKGTKY